MQLAVYTHCFAGIFLPVVISGALSKTEGYYGYADENSTQIQAISSSRSPNENQTEFHGKPLLGPPKVTAIDDSIFKRMGSNAKLPASKEGDEIIDEGNPGRDEAEGEGENEDGNGGKGNHEPEGPAPKTESPIDLSPETGKEEGLPLGNPSTQKTRENIRDKRQDSTSETASALPGVSGLVVSLYGALGPILGTILGPN